MGFGSLIICRGFFIFTTLQSVGFILPRFRLSLKFSFRSFGFSYGFSLAFAASPISFCWRVVRIRTQVRAGVGVRSVRLGSGYLLLFLVPAVVLGPPTSSGFAIGGFYALLWSTVQLQEVPLHQTFAVRTVS